MDIRYEFCLHGAVQRSGTVELVPESYDRLSVEVAPPSSWQEVEEGPERSFLDFAKRFDSEGWSMTIYLGDVLLNDFPLRDIDDGAAHFERQLMLLNGRILQIIVILGVRDPFESVMVLEHPLFLYVTEFSNWEDYDDNCNEDLNGCLGWNLLHPDDSLTILRSVRVRGRWECQRCWVQTRAIAFFWHDCTARLMEEGGRLWECDMMSFGDLGL